MACEIMFVTALFVLLMIVCINDFLFFRIEDVVNLAIVILFFVGCITGAVNDNVLHCLCIASLCFVISLILNHFDLLGGGDVKLLFAIGLFVAGNIVTFLCSLSIYSLVIALLYMAYGTKIENIRIYLSSKVYHIKSKNNVLYKILFPSAGNITAAELKDFKQSNCILKQEIPYGVILSISTISSILLDEMNFGGL